MPVPIFWQGLFNLADDAPYPAGIADVHIVGVEPVGTVEDDRSATA